MSSFLKWLGAYVTVYSRHVCKTSRSKLALIAAVVFALFLAAVLGPLGTAVLVIVVLFVLPAINADVRSEVEHEYRNRK